MRFKITPRGMKSDRARWRLEIGDDYLVVNDDDGRTLADLQREEVLDQVRTPSFLQNRPTYGVMSRGQWVDFQASPEAKLELQALIDREYLRMHPDAASRAVLFGLGKAGGGFLMAGIAVGLTILKNMDEAGRPVWFGGMVIGAVLVVQGLYQASTAGKWRKVAAELAEIQDRRRRRRKERDNRDDDFEDDR